VARALELPEEPARPLADAVRAELRGKRLLLVLDGCERSVSACASLAESVLHADARARVLATSREALDVPGEAVWHVPPLAVPAPEDGPEAAARRESVRLFVERARLHKPGFALAGRAARAAAEICRRLDGIPLAVELAAARARTLPVEQILARLDDPFRLLAGGGRTARPRHRSMRAAIDWTYERLAPRERDLFARLSALDGEFTLAAAEAAVRTADAGAVRPADVRPAEVLDVLTRLVEKSLVLVEERGGESHYRMYGVIRHYARVTLGEAGPEL
jgi:predicted ATPase